jgi:hypothetical protein
LTLLQTREALRILYSGVCKGFTDGTNLPEDDPFPALLEKTPDGLYLAIAFRSPAPVTFAHTTKDHALVLVL